MVEQEVDSTASVDDKDVPVTIERQGPIPSEKEAREKA